LTIGAVGTIAFGASRAFFSDKETSTGNYFTAGAIDLKVDNASYYNGSGIMERRDSTSWGPTDIAGQLFFDFDDIKPGDLGEDTVSLSVTNNPSWICADIDITANSDETCTEPEQLDENNGCVVETNGTNGELASQLNFIFWADDGDNVLETGESILTQGSASAVLGGVTWALADSQNNVWGTAGPVEPDVTKYIGKAWCFGILTPDPVTPGNNSPITNPGVICNGSLVNNAAQTDKLMGDITFRAVQARHNDNFVCVRPNVTPVPTLTPTPTPKSLTLWKEDSATNPWTPLQAKGTLSWAGDGDTFNYNLTANGLAPNTDYSLIYYADPWPGNHPGALIGTGLTDGSGNLVISGNPDLGLDLPDPADANFAQGAKIWLIPSSTYNVGSKSVTTWPPNFDTWLFEGNVYIHYNDTNWP
jgi:predicted ribosomally synthesized peptide with SipW-like signal peptide